MSLNLDGKKVPASYSLPPALKHRVAAEAQKRGLRPSQLARLILERHFRQVDTRRKFSASSKTAKAA